MLRSKAVTATVLLSLAGAGCVEPDLGEAPFFCNAGAPQCPDGYSCVDNICVRGSGTTEADGPMSQDVGRSDMSHADFLMPWPEASVFDGAPPPPDGPTMKWDLGELPDAPKPTTDGWPPHLGCQSHSECTDPSSPCCCPVPLVNQIWACLPLCLNPFCL